MPIDHEYTAEVVCPHCGLEHDTSYEFFDAGNEDAFGIECHECLEVFDAQVHIDIKYSTTIAEE